MRQMRPAVKWSCLAFTLMVSTACNDNVASFHASYDDLKRAGAMERGWIPSWLPTGIHNIYELDNLDSNQTWCRFDFTDADAVVLHNELRGVAGEWPRPVRDPRVEWWPSVLRGRLDLEGLHREGLELFRHESLLFAVNWEKKRAFFYADSR